MVLLFELKCVMNNTLKIALDIAKFYSFSTGKNEEIKLSSEKNEDKTQIAFIISLR